MCVAIAIPSGSTITRAEFDKGWANNPDGGGIAYIHKGRIVTRHSMNRAELWRMYGNAVEAAPSSDMIVHMRIATHGKTCLENCHPFVVDNGSKYDTVFAHNGIIKQVLADISEDANESDSRTFGRLFLNILPPTWFDSPAIFELVEDYLGWANKMVVLTTEKHAKRNLYILNQYLGMTDKQTGVWFSNDSCHKVSRWAYDYHNDWSSSARKSASILMPDEDDIAIDALDAATGQQFFPFGAGYAIGGLSTEWAATVWSEAIDLGYCEICCWNPCNCGAVCHDCTRPFMECECSDGVLFIPYSGSVSIAEYGELGIPGRRRPEPEGASGLFIAGRHKRIHEMSDSDWANLSDEEVSMLLD